MASSELNHVFIIFQPRNHIIIMFNNSNIEKRIESLEAHKIQCDLQHADHVEHRRRLYDKLDEALIYLKNISNILEESKPTIKRSHDNYVTIDTIKNFAVWVTAIATCIASVYAVFHFYG